MTRKLQNIVRNNKGLLQNFSYITILQFVIILSPLITYPYLVRTIGKELYGYVLSAQVLSSYATIIIRFGFDAVSARHISIYRDDKPKLQSTISTIMLIRIILWLICFLIYCLAVNLIPEYKKQSLLFLLSYGMTFQILLFPQFFFQGVEKMKVITIVNVLIQLIFTSLIFTFIKEAIDYIYIPVLYATGYAIGGILSIYIIIKKYDIKPQIPKLKEIKYHLKDAFPLFLTDSITTIKDKLNYILLGIFVNISDVVIYDFGAKLTTLAIQPLQIINIVVFPRMSREKNTRNFFIFGAIIFILIISIVIGLNIFLPFITHFFIGSHIDLFPLRLYLFAPIFLGIGSYIGSNFIVARGYNKYMINSIIITTAIYLFFLILLFFKNKLNSVISFIGLTVLAYLIEMLYRLFIMHKLIKKEHEND